MTTAAQPELRTPRIAAAPLIWIAVAVSARSDSGRSSSTAPIFTPDSGGYVGYAQAMRTSTVWMSDAGLSQGAVPVRAIRMIGYPALIAGAMTIFGGAWLIALAPSAFAGLPWSLLAGLFAWKELRGWRTQRKLVRR